MDQALTAKSHSPPDQAMWPPEKLAFLRREAKVSECSNGKWGLASTDAVERYVR